MTETAHHAGARGLVTDFLFCALLFTYPLLGFLWWRDYPVFSLEVLCLLGIIAAFSAVISLLFSRTRSVVSLLLTAMLVSLSFILHFDLRIPGIAACFLATGVLWRMVGDKFRAYCIPVLLALMGGAYFDSKHEPLPDRSAETASQVNRELGPVVHILLDGFTGIAGLPDYPASALIGADMLSFFKKNDFQVYTHAYSRFSRTGESVYTSMNFRHSSDNTFITEEASLMRHVMRSNAWFDVMEELGYRLNVYQSSHIDLCQSNTVALDRCWQYYHPNVRTGLELEDLHLRTLVLVKSILAQAGILKPLVVKSIYLARVQVAVHDPRVFTELTGDVLKRPMGNFFMAHALIPHGPYVYQADCSVSYLQPPILVVSRVKDEPPLNDQAYEVRTGLYFGQVKCAMDTLQALFDDMRRKGIYDRATIVLHGDHGSRISRHANSVENHKVLTIADYRATYSTLFAVKYPGSEFALRPEVLSVPYLLEEFAHFMRSGDSGAEFNPSMDAEPEKIDPYIYLTAGYPLLPIAIDLFD